MNATVADASRNLRQIRLVLLLTLFIIGISGCCLVFLWLIRYTRRHMRSTRICSLILNLILANLSVYIFATGTQIFWEFQVNREWPFNDFLCRLAKFFQSFSILSSTYIIVAMAVDRCIAIVKPLKAGKIRVLYLCGSAWFLAASLSIPNIFIFQLRIIDSHRYCTAIFNLQSTPTGRRIYLTFISLIVYFIPFLVLFLSYALIFLKLSSRARHQFGSSSSSFCLCRCQKKDPKFSTNVERARRSKNIRSSTSSFTETDPERKRANTYAKARSKTFRMIIVLVLFMIIFGAPYYCLELYTAYTGHRPSDYILALAGGAAVAPSSIDPWIFLLFWVNWNEPADAHHGQSRRFIPSGLQHIPASPSFRANHRSNTMNTSSSSEHLQGQVNPSGSAMYLSPNVHQYQRIPMRKMTR